MGDHQSAECRTGDQGRLEQHDVERERTREPLEADDVGDDRRAGWCIDRPDQRRHPHHCVDREQRRVADEGSDGEQHGGARETDLGHEQDAAPVEPVGDSTARERAGDQRHCLHQSEQADGKRRPSERVDLERDRDQRDLASDQGDELPDEEAAEWT